MKKIIRTVIRRFQKAPRPSMRQLLGIIPELSWQKQDALYISCRQNLLNNPRWRQGSLRIYESASEWITCFAKHSSIQGKTYLDLGCGNFHPYGMSTVFYLNGVDCAHAVDIQTGDEERWALALFDLLANVLCFPEKWCFEEQSIESMIARLREFDLEALLQRDMMYGIRDVPLTHHVCDFNTVNIPESSIDLFASRAVLEHFLDLKSACQRLYSLCSDGAIGVHHIDLRDHRAYQSGQYHYWSFLTDNSPRNNGKRNSQDECYPRAIECLSNRLRWHEVQSLFEESGFTFLEVNLRKETLPVGLRNVLISKYSHLSDDELQITGSTFVIKKNSETKETSS